MDILKLIKEYNLIYLPLDKLVKSISKITSEAEIDVKNAANELLNNGLLFLDDENKVSISSDKGYYKAKLIVNKKGYGFAVVDNFPDFFIPQFALNGAFDGDDCIVEIISQKTEQEIEGRVVKVIKHNTTHVVGTYIEGKNKNVVFPDDTKFPQIRIFKANTAKARNNDKVWVALDMASLETKIPTGTIIEVLGQANTPKAEQISIIRSFGLVDRFDDKVLRCARAVNQNVDIKNFKKRKNFTSQNVITIDGEDARDFDDAIAVEKTKDGGYVLYVHIADVSNYVVENSELDKEAQRRGTSVYFPNMVIPMLPKELSNGICSLNENVNRLVLTVVITLNKNCIVQSSEIVEGVIQSKHRMTYTEVENILKGDELLIEKFQDVYEDILAYQFISNELKKQKHARGEMRMNLPEPFILENNNGEIVSIEKRVQDESHEIIESLMVLANECVAKKFYDLSLPFVYRVHEKPEQEKVKKLSQLLKNLGVNNNLDVNGDKTSSYQEVLERIDGSKKEKILTMLILRTMMKAKYSPVCLGHFGLASEFYCHFTSPIRRYPDLQIHRIIKDYLHGMTKDELNDKYKPIVPRISDHSSITEKNADEAEREMDDYKKSVYMQKFLGDEFEGIVSGVQEFGIFVELDNGIEGLVRTDSLPLDNYEYDDMNLTLYGEEHHFSIGDEVNVVVANTNTQLHQIDFELLGVRPKNKFKKFQSSKPLEESKLTNTKQVNHKKSRKFQTIKGKKHK